MNEEFKMARPMGHEIPIEGIEGLAGREEREQMILRRTHAVAKKAQFLMHTFKTSKNLRATELKNKKNVLYRIIAEQKLRGKPLTSPGGYTLWVKLMQGKGILYQT